MWCEKCHYGSETVQWKLDSNGNFNCQHCGTSAPPLNRTPFGSKAGRTLHGGRSSGKDKPVPKKFVFDQKGGSDTDAPAIEKVEKVVNKPVEQAGKVSEQSVGRPVDKPIISPEEKK